MKTLKEFIIEEGLIKRQSGVDVKAKIESWLKEHEIKKYTINADMTIDVGSVVLKGYQEEQLPEYIQFGKVKCFIVDGSPKLKSLKGAPQKVDGYFTCSKCPKLESLEGAPQKVGTWFDCSECDKLKSLKGAPQKVGGGFYCTGCKNLKSLEGAPQKVGESFNCDYCGVKFTKDDVRKVCDVKGLIIV